MSSAQERKQNLIEHRVITDVLPGELDLKYDLTVKFPEATLDKMGEEIGRDETQPEPTLSLSPAPSKPLNNLVLIVTDPDMMMSNDTYFGQIRHWLVTGISTDTSGTLSLGSSSTISPYVGPAPLPNYMYSRPHRYVFIVASSSGDVNISSDDLRELQKPYVAAMAGNQESQDIKDRWGFNAQKLIEMKGLKVEAVNFMRVGGTVKSGVVNAGMMAQGMANKVIGK